MSGGDNIVICEVVKGGGKVVRATIATYQGGAPFLDIREYYLKADGESAPTKKGATIPMTALPQLATALWAHLENTAPAKLKIV